MRHYVVRGVAACARVCIAVVADRPPLRELAMLCRVMRRPYNSQHSTQVLYSKFSIVVSSYSTWLVRYCLLWNWKWYSINHR